jgi:hypothetical protein
MEIKCNFYGWMLQRINELLLMPDTFDRKPMPIPRLNASTNQYITKYICPIRRFTHQSLSKCIWHVFMDAKCQLHGWMHQQLNETLSTSSTFEWNPMQIRRLDNTQWITKHICPVFMDVKCQFQAWMHPRLNELLSTSATFDGSPMPTRSLKAWTHQRIANYICHVLSRSSNDLKLEWG